MKKLACLSAVAALSLGLHVMTVAPAASQQDAAVTAAGVAADQPTLAQLKDLIARAEQEQPAGRENLLVDAVKLFDRLSVGGQNALEGFDAQGFLARVVTLHLEFAKLNDIETAARDRALVSARDIVPRLHDGVLQARLYVDVARLEFASGDKNNGLAVLRKANIQIAGLPAGRERDEAQVGVIRVILPLQVVDLETKFRWTLRVDDPMLSRQAMRAVALSEIAGRRAGKPILAAAALKDKADRASALAVQATAHREAGKFERALLAALVIDDDHVALRDAALQQVFDAQIGRGMRPEAVFSAYALTDDAGREKALLRLATYSVERGRLALARDVVGHIKAADERCQGLTSIASRLDREKLKAAWSAAWDMALDSASLISDQPRRTAAYLQLGLQAAGADDVQRAMAAAQHSGPSAEAILAGVALSDLRAGRLDRAKARYNGLVESANRSKVGAALYSALARSGRAAEADPYFAAATAPEDRVTVLLARSALAEDMRSLARDPVLAADALSAAAAEIAAIQDPAAREAQAVAVARVFAARGMAAEIDRLLAQATPSERSLIAVQRAVALVIGGTDPVPQAVEQVPVALRDNARSEIAQALSRQENPIAAFDAAKAIGNERLRRSALRRIAEDQAKRSEGRDLDPSFSAGKASSRMKDVAISSGNFVLTSVNSGSRKEFDVPNVTVRADDVRRMVPATTPGVARLVPTGFSNFDEKFSHIRYLNSVDLNGGEEEILAKGQGTLFPQFISIENGVFDLPELKAQLAASSEGGDTAITEDGRTYQLNVPLLIGRNATLVVSSTDVEELRLNTLSHAYIVNSGRLFIIGAKVTSWDPTTSAPTPRSEKQWNEFSPFYTAWSGSETYFAEAHINGLGYANGKSYGISISSGPVNVLKATLNTLPRPKGIIVDSTFTDMYYGFYSYEADDFQLVGNDYANNEIYAIDPHDRSTNLTIAYNTTWGTRVKHGTITSREVKHSIIVGNVSADNKGSGFMLDRSSDDNVVAYNLAFRNKADGMTVYESSCNLIFRNTFTGNGRDGLKLRNSWDLMVSENAIDRNEGFGVNLYSSRLEGTPEAAHRDFNLDPYRQYANVSAFGNVIGVNGKSVFRGADSSAIVLQGNRFSSTDAKLFQQSDFADLSSSLLTFAGDGAGLRDSCQPVRPAVGCGFVTEGYFGRDLVAELEREGPAEQCEATN